MIDWRTHALSLVAVFLALGIGIAIGGMLGSKGEAVVAEQQSVIRDLEGRLAKADDDLQALRQELLAEESARQAAEELLAQLVQESAAGLLAGRQVALVNLGAPTLEGEALAALRTAGARAGPILTIDPAVVAGGAGVLGRLAMAEGAARPLADYAAGWAQGLLTHPDGFDPALQAGVRAGALSFAPGDLDEAAPRAPDGLVLLLPGPVGDLAWRSLVTPFVEAGRALGVRVVLAADDDPGEDELDARLREAPVATVADLGEAAGDLALVRAVAGADGHFGPSARDDGLWPPAPRAASEAAPVAGSGR
ncbi:MAG: copper transporter [Clostridia bacterium]|nr:copper transporter [Clostridia bacterium]